MSRIVRLSEEVANQIAAGEVVERPASVVKELLENAVDAEATRIDIEVEGGGVDRIRLVDDGLGMSRQEATLCLERHATSKIRAATDLESVSTFGFRGEAIPSIASVSRFRLLTRARGEEAGTQIQVEAGRLVGVETAGAPEGTSVLVEDLFYNVPARRKFLKRPQTELSHVTDAVERLALARPDLSVRLRHQGRVLLDAPRGSDSDPRGRLARILGKKVAEALHPIAPAKVAGPVQVRGWISSPEIQERSARHLRIFVNGRFVRDRTIHHAVQNAYRDLLDTGRSPIVVLFVEVAPGLVDVNVHPQKTEVRFSDTGLIHRVVSGALVATLSEAPWEGVRPFALESPDFAAAPAHAGDRVAEAWASFGRPAASASSSAASLGRAWTDRLAGGPNFRDRLESARRAPEARGPSDSSGRPSAPQQAPAASSESALLFGRYLVRMERDGLLLVDVPRARARICEARLRARGRGEGETPRAFLIPDRLELGDERAACLERHRAWLEPLGFGLEPLDARTWVLKTVPRGLERADSKVIIDAVLDAIAKIDPEQAETEGLERVIEVARAHILEASVDDVDEEALLHALASLEPSLQSDVLRHLDEASLEALFEGT